MTVVTVYTFTVKPDGYEAWLAVARKSKPLWERLGAKNIRFLAGLVAGGQTGSMAFSFEADDFSAYGAVVDRFLADPEGLALMGSLNTSASPIGPYQNTLWVDVPL